MTKVVSLSFLRGPPLDSAAVLSTIVAYPNPALVHSPFFFFLVLLNGNMGTWLQGVSSKLAAKLKAFLYMTFKIKTFLNIACTRSSDPTLQIMNKHRIQSLI